mgnify:CR=1 FL=1
MTRTFFGLDHSDNIFLANYSTDFRKFNDSTKYIFQKSEKKT